MTDENDQAAMDAAPSLAEVMEQAEDKRRLGFVSDSDIGFWCSPPITPMPKLTYQGEDAESLYHERNRYRKEARKLQDRINRIDKLIPGSKRIWNLHTISMYLEADADVIEEHNIATTVDVAGMRDDALFLRRMEHDLISMREAVGRAVRGSRNRKYDPAQWPRGERP